MTREEIYLMSYDEWDLNQDERDAIKAIIAERDGLSLECDRWQYAQDKLKEIVTLEELKNKQLKAENERLRAADKSSEEYILVLIGVIKELGPILPYTRLVEAERKYRIASVALEPKP